MLGGSSGLELFWNRRGLTVRKGHAMWIWIPLPFNKNRMKVSIKKSNFELPWNYLKLCEHLHSKSLSERQNSETDVSLKKFLKNRFMFETICSGNLNLPLRMFISNHSTQFQLTIVLVQATIVVKMFYKLAAPLYNSFLILRVCNGFNVS